MPFLEECAALDLCFKYLLRLTDIEKDIVCDGVLKCISATLNQQWENQDSSTAGSSLTSSDPSAYTSGDGEEVDVCMYVWSHSLRHKTCLYKVLCLKCKIIDKMTRDCHKSYYLWKTLCLY